MTEGQFTQVLMYELDAIRKVMPSIHHVLSLSNSALILFWCINNVPFFYPNVRASLQEDYQPPCDICGFLEKASHKALP